MQNIICRKAKKRKQLCPFVNCTWEFFFYKLMDKDSIQFLLKFIWHCVNLFLSLRHSKKHMLLPKDMTALLFFPYKNCSRAKMFTWWLNLCYFFMQMRLTYNYGSRQFLFLWSAWSLKLLWRPCSLYQH